MAPNRKPTPPLLDPKIEREIVEASITFVTQIGELSKTGQFDLLTGQPQRMRSRDRQRIRRIKAAKPQDLAKLQKSKVRQYSKSIFMTFAMFGWTLALLLMIGVRGRYTPLNTGIARQAAANAALLRSVPGSMTPTGSVTLGSPTIDPAVAVEPAAPPASVESQSPMEALSADAPVVRVDPVLPVMPAPGETVQELQLLPPPSESVKRAALQRAEKPRATKHATKKNTRKPATRTARRGR